MSDQDVWIFISYAHNDDLQTSASKDEKGFVTFFQEMLDKKLADLARPGPRSGVTANASATAINSRA